MALAIVVVGLAWARVMAEGYDFNWQSVLNLLALLALLVLALRSKWGRAGVGAISYKHGGVSGGEN